MRSLVAALSASITLLSALPARAACDNPYFPLKEGQTRTFKSSTGRETKWTVTKSEGSKATIETEFLSEKDKDAKAAPHTVSAEVECSAEGVTLDLSKMSASGQQGGMELKVVKHSGVTIPAAAKMKPGETFESSQTVEMSSPRMQKPMTMEGKTTSKVVGTETIKVAAGEFTAMKIETETQMTMSMPEGMAAKHPGAPAGGMTMTSKGTVWVVKGIGMVKNEQTIAGMGGAPGAPSTPSSSELISYSK